MKTATRAERTAEEIRSDPAVQAWAQRMAAHLPPFTAAEAAAVGRIAARIDARIIQAAQR